MITNDAVFNKTSGLDNRLHYKGEVVQVQPRILGNLPCRLQEILLYGTLRPVLMRVEVDGDSPFPQMRSFVNENNSFTRC